MARILLPENIPQVVKASGTSLTLATTYLGQATRINVGGQQYTPASTVTLNTGTTGFNGIDTGTFTANTLYYVYAVVSNNVLGMIISTSGPSTGPTGFTSAYRAIGRMVSNQSTQISWLVQLKEAFTEYAFNTSGITAAGSSNTTSFGYGQEGAAIGAINNNTLNNETTMRIRWLVARQSADSIRIETDEGTSSARWTPVGPQRDICYFNLQGTARYGIGLSQVNSTDMDVGFGNRGRLTSSATYTDTGLAWSDVSAWNWRVVKVSPNDILT